MKISQIWTKRKTAKQIKSTLPFCVDGAIRANYCLGFSDNLPYEKVGKNEPVCIADEVPFDIPESWEWVRLKDIVVKEIKRGKSPTYADNSSVLVFAQKCNTKAGIIDLSLAKHLDFKSFAKYSDDEYMQDGDIVVNSTGNGTLGRVGVFHDSDRSNDCVIVPDSHVTTIRINKTLVLDYIYYALVYYQPYFEKSCSGSTNQTELKPLVVANLFIPVPPFKEQRRIIRKLSSVLPLVTKYDEKEVTLEIYNTAFPAQLKKSILQDAVQGKLVSQNPADEPASVLLEHIRTEKEQLVKAGKIKRDKHESVIFRRDNSYYEISGKNEVCIDDQIPFDVPESWEWTRLGNVLASTDAGKSPQCEDRSCNKGEAGVIKTTAVQDGYFLPNENKILPTSFTIQKDQLIRKGDLLITRAGPRNRTGVLCVVDVECEKLILSDKTVRLAYIRNNVNPHYLQIALSSPAIQNMVVKAMSGMAESQVNISQSNMKKFLIPIPPLNEQNRIVDKYKTVYSAFVNKFEFLL